MTGVWWPPNTTSSGICDLSIGYADTGSLHVANARANGPASKIFIARVNWDLGEGGYINLTNIDRLLFAESTFHAAVNSQFPNPNRLYNGTGPFWFAGLTNVVFRNNAVSWATGGISFKTTSDIVIEGNRFARSASDKVIVDPSNFTFLNGNPAVDPIHIGESAQRMLGRQLAINFLKNAVIENNVFEVSDGVFRNNQNDGETINSEGGGPSPMQDVGTVTAADAASVTDNSKAGPWNYGSGYKIAIMSGKGWGQWRNIVSQSNNTFTVDRAWDIVPAAGDHFSIFRPSLENGLIRSNVARDNPSGILLYHAGFLNVSIINNALTDNGGILLSATQDPLGTGRPPQAGAARNIEIAGNTLTDTKSQWSLFFAIYVAALSPETIWGTAMDEIEIRNNSLNAKAGNPVGVFGLEEGYLHKVFYQNSHASYDPNSAAPAIIGSVFQGNRCTACSASYTLSTGVADTVIWNAVNGTGGPPLVLDQKLSNTAAHASLGTTIGGD